MFSPEFKTLAELKSFGRKKIIELAKAAAREAGSRMVPDDDRGIKVLANDKTVRVILAKGYRAYTDDGARVITTVSVVVDFQDAYPSVSWEGNDILNDQDRKALELVLKTMPPNYEYIGITIADDPAQDKDNYIVSLDGAYAMGRHSVNKMSGEWNYITHKHYARGHELDEKEFKELLN
jgi:hypothetical protein